MKYQNMLCRVYQRVVFNVDKRSEMSISCNFSPLLKGAILFGATVIIEKNDSILKSNFLNNKCIIVLIYKVDMFVE